MTNDFEIQRFSRRCAKTDRELQPGELFYSALVWENGAAHRRDYSADAWRELGGQLDQELIGCWKGQVPAANAQKLNWAPSDVMLDYFEQLERQPDKQDVRFLLGLLLVRRKIVRLEESKREDGQRETLVLFCPKTERVYELPVLMPDQQRAAEIQAELVRLLFSQAA